MFEAVFEQLNAAADTWKTKLNGKLNRYKTGMNKKASNEKNDLHTLQRRQ